jgi:phosphate transport system substrate-binding protein
MEKLKEAYKVLNPNITVEVQQSDSTTGIQAAISNTCDIAMSSRDLTTTETLVGTKICLDGIAIIVNKKNSLENMLSTDITKIYIGDAKKWNFLSK